MARTVNRTRIELELAQLESEISNLASSDPLEGARIKTVRPGGTAGKPSKARGYARLIFADGGSRAIDAQDVATYQQRIDAARAIRRLQRRRDALVARLA